MTQSFLCQPEHTEGGFYGWKPDLKRRKTFEEAQIKRAQAFYAQGLAKAEQGDFMGSWLAFGRASRLLPTVPYLSFAYALSCLTVKAPKLALVRMTDILEKYDYRGAAFGRISALLQMRDLESCVTASRYALRRFAVGADIWEVVLFVAKQAGFKGCAGVTMAGELWLAGEGEAALYLDGRFLKKKTLTGDLQKISLPESWRKAEILSIKTAPTADLLISEIDLLAMRRMKSLAWGEGESVYGWVEYPADPDFPPVFTACVHGGKKQKTRVAAGVKPLFYEGLGEPAVYEASFSEGREKEIVLEDSFGRPLWGSPLSLGSGEGAIPKLAPPLKGRSGENRDYVIVMPVFGNEKLVRRTLACLLKTLPLNQTEKFSGEILIVNDGGLEKSLNTYLQRLSKAKKITLLTHETQKGFAVSVNSALKHAQGRDVILFNSDAIAFGDWALRLLAYLNLEKAGTITPFGNNAGQLTFPVAQDHSISVNEAKNLDRLFQVSRKSSNPVTLLTGNGFCMAISAECLAKTGGMREGVFAQAYGEEVDFCLRASQQGFKHFAAEKIYVYHEGRGSIGGAGAALFSRNQEILQNFYPNFALEVRHFEAAKPFRAFFHLISEKCLQKKIQKKKPVLIVSHALGGGVACYVAQRKKMIEKTGKKTLLLVPTQEGCRLGILNDEGVIVRDETMLSFSLPKEQAFLITALRSLKITEIEYHHFAGHSPVIRGLAAEMGIAPHLFVHDHAAFCPHITLIGENGHYCGEPEEDLCQACAVKVAQQDQKEQGGQEVYVPDIQALKRQTLSLMRQAAGVYTPSQDSALRLKRHFPQITPQILSPEEDQALFHKNRRRGAQSKKYAPHHIWRIGVVGALSEWKGAFLLEKIAKTTQKAKVPVKFFLIGHAVNESALESAGVEITGTFQEEELPELLNVLDLDAVLLPSIAPETWGYAFSHVLEAGLFTFCFDIGSVAERIRSLGEQAGFILPLDFPPERIGYFLAEKLRQR